MASRTPVLPPIRTFTVGPGIPPGQPPLRAGAGRGLSPPVRTYTDPGARCGDHCSAPGCGSAVRRPGSPSPWRPKPVTLSLRRGLSHRAFARGLHRSRDRFGVLWTGRSPHDRPTTPATRPAVLETGAACSGRALIPDRGTGPAIPTTGPPSSHPAHHPGPPFSRPVQRARDGPAIPATDTGSAIPTTRPRPHTQPTIPATRHSVLETGSSFPGTGRTSSRPAQPDHLTASSRLAQPHHLPVVATGP